ncbi:MAG: stage II sporulation protein D [Oscillospiraceae bacterium]|nr:stage II sporulation protein D [Oscillospiraceae bacterium]
MKELPLDAYLASVLLQEMPASFAEEAHKAQAVAARTFTLRNIYEGSRHADADVCGDSGCCQCYLDEAEGRACYGDAYDEVLSQAREAVAATDGQVLTYEDELIVAAYFSSAAGATETAAAVWGGEVPYLQSVSSPEEIRSAEQRFTEEEIRAAFPETSLSANPAAWFGAAEKTEGGSVASMEVGGIAFSGAEIRSRLGLRSANFSVAVTEDGIVFEVFGSGHGVGMSQYGADAMAAAGQSYAEILAHYYPGTVLQQLS